LRKRGQHRGHQPAKLSHSGLLHRTGDRSLERQIPETSREERHSDLALVYADWPARWSLLQPQQLVQAHHQALYLHHLANCDQYARHEGRAIRGVVSNSQRLSLSAKEHFLVSNQTRKTHTMNAHAIPLGPTSAGYRLFRGNVVAEGAT